MLHRLPRLAVSAVLLFGALLDAPAVLAGVAAPNVATGVTAAATGGYLEGVDVSHWQNSINWSKVAAAGKSFAIIKATESTDVVDSLYATNRSGARAAGLWTGAYHFARPNATAGDAVAEANHFADSVHLGAGDLLPALDIEVSGGLNPSALTAWVTAWLNQATARLGVKPMIYTSPSFWKNALADTRSLADAGYKTLWVAHWGVSAPTVPAQNWGGRGWTFWQYDNCGSVSGISGCVDLDRYHGTDLTTQGFSGFSLATRWGGYIKQGHALVATVGISRTNFTGAVALAVRGLPAGATAAWDQASTTGTSTDLRVYTDAPDTPTGVYPLTVTGTSGGTVRTTSLSLVVTDGVPPKLTAPVTLVSPNTYLGKSSIPVRVLWTATDPSGVASTGLQRSLNAGTWQSVTLPSSTAQAGWTSAPRSGSFRARARATDKVANTSAWSYGPTVASSVVEQTSTAVRFAGTWSSSNRSWVSGGSLRYTTRPGSSVSYTFTGSSVGWVSVRCSTCGSAWVYVDGKFAGSVNLASSTYHSGAIVWGRNWTAAGTHTVKILVAKTAKPTRVDVDAFVRLRIG